MLEGLKIGQRCRLKIRNTSPPLGLEGQRAEMMSAEPRSQGCLGGAGPCSGKHGGSCPMAAGTIKTGSHTCAQLPIGSSHWLKLIRGQGTREPGKCNFQGADATQSRTGEGQRIDLSPNDQYN